MKQKLGLLLASILLVLGISGCAAPEITTDFVSDNTATIESIVEEPSSSVETPSESTEKLLSSVETPPESTEKLPSGGKESPSDAEEAGEDGKVSGERVLPAQTLDEDGEYDGKEEVALYLHIYGRLPSNYITKKEAQALGWEGGSLEPYAPGKSIGGDYFGNYEEKLPRKKGRKYYECDIGTMGAKKRGAKRIIYSNDGLVFYTDDHYETFEQLY